MSRPTYHGISARRAPLLQSTLILIPVYTTARFLCEAEAGWAGPGDAEFHKNNKIFRQKIVAEGEEPGAVSVSGIVTRNDHTPLALPAALFLDLHTEGSERGLRAWSGRDRPGLRKVHGYDH